MHEPLPYLDIFARLGVAFLLGALMGLERERKNRPAGFRTMILICLGSAGFMIAAQEAIIMANMQTWNTATAANPAPVSTFAADVSRVLQGLIGGIGFLGAGAVIQNKKSVRGLTSAAAIWVAACIGASSGLGLFRLAAILAAFTLFTLVVLELVENKFFPDPYEDDGKKNGDSDVMRAQDGNGKLGPRGE